MTPPRVWISSDDRTLYVLWWDGDSYQAVSEDGPDGERWTLPADARPLTRGAAQLTGQPG